MSEYKCEEPGCNFHIGIAGDLVTDQDFEQQDYYDQEVEEHYQMHKAEAENGKQDNYFVNVDPATAAWLDQHGLMRSWQNKSGQAVPNPLHDPTRTISEVVGSPFSRVAAEGDRLTVPVNASGVASSDIFPEGRQELGVRIEMFGAVSGDRRLRIDVEHDSVSATCFDLKLDVAVRSMRPPHVDSLNERSDDFRGGSQGRVPVDLKPDFHSSLSVGAPRGAVGSTPESTERGQNPTASEKEMLSAVAPAEGEAKLERSNPRAGRARSLGQADGDAGLDQKLLLAVRQADLDPLSRSALHDLLDALAEGRDVFIVTDPDLVWAIEKLLGHSSSLSVDDAPDGAVGGTSESTERGLTPTSSEKGKPSAFAPAEGQEINSNGK